MTATEEGQASRGLSPLWKGLLVRAAALPALVTLPLLGLAFRADERFNVYRFGAEYSRRPEGLLVDQIADVPRFLRNGNFRPVGRVAERLQELVAFQVADALGIAPHVVMRGFAVLAVGLLSVALVLVVQTLASPAPLAATPPTRAASLVAPLLAVGLVAAGNQSAVVLFTNLYVHASLLVLGVALFAARRGQFTIGPGGPVRLLGAAVLGAVCASYNEIAYIAVPAAIVMVVARGRTSFRLPWRVLPRTRAARWTVAFVVGFAAVFVPVRVVIARLCADVSCYAQSAIDLSPDAAGLLLQRVTSWFPPPAWSVAAGSSPGRWYLTSNLVLLALGALAVLLTVQLVRLRPALAPTPVDAAVALVALGVVLTVLPGVIGAISEGRLADWRAGSIRPGAGWRDTPLLLAGSALVLSGAAELVVGRLPHGSRRPVAGLATAALGLGVALTVLANDTFATRDAWRQEPNLHHRIAADVVSFERSEAADARRCALLAEFTELHPTKTQHIERLRLGLDEVARRAADRPWCEAAT